MNTSFYDSEGLGYLREQDLENYVYDHIPTMAALHAIHDNFYPFYVFTAVRRFMFFLDPKRTGEDLPAPVLVRFTLFRVSFFPIGRLLPSCLDNVPCVDCSRALPPKGKTNRKNLRCPRFFERFSIFLVFCNLLCQKRDSLAAILASFVLHSYACVRRISSHLTRKTSAAVSPFDRTGLDSLRGVAWCRHSQGGADAIEAFVCSVLSCGGICVRI